MAKTNLFILIVFIVVTCVRAHFPPRSCVRGSDFTKRSTVHIFYSRTAAKTKRSLWVRGGKVVSDDNEDDTEDESASNADKGEVNAGDFEGEDTLMRRIKSAIEKTPPITQGFITASIAITVGSFILNQNQWPQFLFLDWGRVAHGQIWRMITTFLYFGPLDLSYGLTVQFIWQYMAQLEKVHHKEPEQVFKTQIWSDIYRHFHFLSDLAY